MMRATKSILPTLSGFVAIMLLTGCGKIGTTSTGVINPIVKGVDTKSAPVIIDDNNTYDEKPGTHAEKISVNGFVMDAWLESAGHDNETGDAVPVHYIDKASVTHGDSWVIDGEPKWLNEITTRFWCWNKNASSSGLDTEKAYTQTSDVRNFSFSVPANASNRGDIVMAYTKKAWTDSKNDNVYLRFFHPVVNICFLRHDNFSENMEITEIKLKNVYRQGDFTFTGNGAEDGDSQTAVFTWSNLSSKGDLSETESNGLSKANLSDFNFFIPEQTLSSDTRLSVTFRRNDGSTVTREASLFESDPSASFKNKWLAGHYYCYRIEATEALNQPITFTVSLVSWAEYTETDGDLTLDY